MVRPGRMTRRACTDTTIHYVQTVMGRVARPCIPEQQNVIGIADIDTRAITRRLRDTGCLNGVLTTDDSKSDDELVVGTDG